MRNTVTKDFPIALTFDVDWAPDYAIQECLDIINEHQVPATFFVTHETDLLAQMEKCQHIQLGIHPNFLPYSTHGSTLDEVMHYVLALCPNATALRTHGLYQTSNMYFTLLKKYPQIKHDFSLFLSDCHLALPVKFHSDDNTFLIRTPYQWEDDLFFLRRSRGIEDVIFHEAHYQIFDFHPIHVYLNSENENSYKQIKSNLTTASEAELSNYKNAMIGTRNYLEHILTSVTKDRFVFATDIPGIMQKPTSHADFVTTVQEVV